MNDISLKIVDSLKEQPAAAEPPPEVPETENEVDPLAIDESEAAAVTDSLVVEVLHGKEAGICDENAKEEKLSENGNVDKDNLVALQAEKIKEELLKEDSNSFSGDEEIADKLRQNEPTSIVQEKAPESEPVAVEPSSLPTYEIVKEQEQLVNKPVSAVHTPPVRETTPPKEVAPTLVIEKPVVQLNVETDVDMTDVATAEEKIDSKVDIKPKPQPVNGDVPKVSSHKEDTTTKRRASEEVETKSPLKRLCQEVEKTFPQHDTMINDYIQTATKNNIDEIQRHTEQLLSEIQTLRELAQKKEQEWNNILHLKKVKEEILLRLLRQKQVLSFEKAAEVNGADRTDPFEYLNQVKNLAIDKSDEISGLAIKQPPMAGHLMMPTHAMPVTSHFNPMSGLPPPYDKSGHIQSMPKPVFPQPLMMPGPMPGFPRDMNMNGHLSGGFNLPMGRQGPTKDVKSIIADYRQRNPDITPRRGRRMKSLLNPNMMNTPRPIAPKMDSMSNINSLNNLNMLFNNLDMNQKAMLERLQQMQAGGLPNGLSFKDVLVQFANMQQSSGLIPNRPPETATRPEHHVRPEPRRRPERSHEEVVKQVERLASPSPRLPPPPPYPEISLLPVTTAQESSTSQQNSLLHGILTKNCGEITITPVQPTPPPDPQLEKPEEVVQLDDEEDAASEGSAAGSPAGSGSGSGSGRLVIDEGGAGGDDAGAGPAGGGAGGGSGAVGGAGAAGAGGEAPICQGCRRKDAQFVCAGCANQWYCSRDCQVAAWDEHSEMCSG